MSRIGVWWLVSVLVALVLVPALTTRALPQVPRGTTTTVKPAPRLEAVAETRLLMEGLAEANFRGLEKTLGKKPADIETWTFARGQALLLAETANLLMLRPPKNQGQDVWLSHSRDLRDAATELARTIAARDHARSVTGMDKVATACNQCHRTFRVNVRMVPFADTNKRASLPE